MAAQAWLDGTEVTNVVVFGKSTPRLNKISQGEIKIPTDYAIGGVGSRLKIAFDGALDHHGRVLHCSDGTEEDGDKYYTVYQSSSPMEMWSWRPMRDGADSPTPGNMVTPTVLERKLYGGAILQEVLQQSIDGSDQEIGEGTMFQQLGSFASGGANLSGAPVSTPMTIADLASLLVSTGTIDIVETPIDSGGNMTRVDVVVSPYGTDRSGSIVFGFGEGTANNVRELRRTEDMTELVNKLQYFFTPRETTERYKGNITADDPCLDLQFGAGAMPPLLGARAGSRSAYGVRMRMDEFDVDVLYKEQNPPGTCVFLDPTRSVFRYRWYLEQRLSQIPRTLVHVTPVRGYPVTAFGIGDLVGVQCASWFRGGFSGKQRVYERTATWDEEGVTEISDLVVSADQEGATP